jgi:hypothetical protein
MIHSIVLSPLGVQASRQLPHCFFSFGALRLQSRQLFLGFVQGRCFYALPFR